MASVLFVCLGNICRSPTAEAVFRKRASDAGLNITVDSAGTGAWHAGEPPDPRAQAAGRRRGYSFQGQTARKVAAEDFGKFDYILAMDSANLSDLKSISDPVHHHKVRLFLEFAVTPCGRDVPDPYYGGEDGFAHVVDLIENASDGFITHLKAG